MKRITRIFLKNGQTLDLPFPVKKTHRNPEGELTGLEWSDAGGVQVMYVRLDDISIVLLIDQP